MVTDALGHTNTLYSLLLKYTTYHKVWGHFVSRENTCFVLLLTCWNFSTVFASYAQISFRLISSVGWRVRTYIQGFPKGCWLESHVRLNLHTSLIRKSDNFSVAFNHLIYIYIYILYIYIYIYKMRVII